MSAELMGEADREYEARLEADRVTAAWRNRADRQIADLEWSPLFQGESIALDSEGRGVRTVERQKGLFEGEDEK